MVHMAGGKDRQLKERKTESAREHIINAGRKWTEERKGIGRKYDMIVNSKKKRYDICT